MTGIAIFFMVVNLLVGIYCGLLLLNHSRIRKHLKVMMKNGIEYFPKHIATFIHEHPNYHWFLWELVELKGMLEDFVNTHLKEN
ncbi:MAG: hypothetical protein WC495_06860 [Patescibacteria group bacterium]|jgi:hypothetical protein